MVEYVRTEKLCSGDILARTIYDDKGRILLREGNKLTDASITAITTYKYKGVYIVNYAERREHIPIPEPLVDDLIWLKLAGYLSEMYAIKDCEPYDINFVTLRKKIEEIVKEIVDNFYEYKAADKLLYETEDARSQNSWLYFHSINTCLITIGICIYLGLEKNRTYDIALGGIYHDLGKMYLPASLINKKGISCKERNQIREHAEYGFRLFQKINLYSIDTTYAIWFHHEREDGSGYPHGVMGDKIPLGAKIVGLASSYDNMINYNPYNRKPLSQQEALELLSGDIKFDTSCVSAMMKFIVPYPIGTKVTLSSGAEGLVLKNVTSLPLRPYILCGKNVLNLSEDEKYRAIVITKC